MSSSEPGSTQPAGPERPEPPELPEWHARALAEPSTEGRVMVDGASIRYVTWGERGRPGIVLVHGSNANLEWWRFVAPFLAPRFHVVAFDSSGNGDSGWRERYSREVLGDEVRAVAEAAGLAPRPVVVGHSFGGFVVLEAAHRHGDAFAGVIFMDFTVHAPEQYVEWGLRAEREGVAARRATRVYADRAAAMARFRLLPDQPVRYPAVLQHLAATALRPVDGGWTWKFDPTLFDHLEMGRDQRDRFAGLRCRSAVVLGEHSTDEGAFGAPHMAAISQGILPIFTIPCTHHHLMFDEPMAVVTAIQAIALTWAQADRADEYARAMAALRG